MTGKRATRKAPALRARVWVEAGAAAALTEAGADLLDQIDACGSLSEAARRLRYSYRRAWMLAAAMNKRWPPGLVAMSTGGKGGGGARLTDLGRLVLRSFREVQLQVEAAIDQATPAFLAATRHKP